MDVHIYTPAPLYIRNARGGRWVAAEKNGLARANPFEREPSKQRGLARLSFFTPAARDGEEASAREGRDEYTAYKKKQEEKNKRASEKDRGRGKPSGI